MAEEPRGEFAPHAPNGNGAHFARLALVERDKSGSVQDDLGSIRHRPTHHNREIRLRDSAQKGVMHHPVQEFRGHASHICRDPWLEAANGGEEGGPLRELVRLSRGH
eukprot:6365782-Amphidinium_carterae.1